MNISIHGNKCFYQESNEFINVEYVLKGEPSLNYDNDFMLFKDNTPLICLKQNQVFQLSEKIKGCEFSFVPDFLKEYGLDNLTYLYLQKSTEQEIGIIKSIFLTYQWTAYAFPIIDGNEIDLSSYVFDEFIIDVNNRIGNQLDMYFLPKELKLDEIQSEICILMKLNLLCKIEISHKNVRMLNYFIPLLKPGTTKSGFTKLDLTGKAIKLWFDILKSRDIKLKLSLIHI